jgi:predicted glutamine amidotransferase
VYSFKLIFKGDIMTQLSTTNKQKAIEIVSYYTDSLEFQIDKFRDDKDVVLAAVKKDGYSLFDASNRLQNDKEIVLAAVNESGEALQFASDCLKDDEEVVLAAIKNNDEALFFASTRMYNNITSQDNKFKSIKHLNSYLKTIGFKILMTKLNKAKQVIATVILNDSKREANLSQLKLIQGINNIYPNRSFNIDLSRLAL